MRVKSWMVLTSLATVARRAFRDSSPLDQIFELYYDNVSN